MTSTKIISGNSTKQNSGVVAYGGAVGSIMATVGFDKLQATQPENNVITTSDSTLTKAVSAGNLATSIAGVYVGIGYSNKLANSVTPSASIGASDSTDHVSIMSISGLYTINYTDWSYMSGVASFSNAITHFAHDHAAIPTRTIPGELTTMETGATPTNFDYPSKNV